MKYMVTYANPAFGQELVEAFYYQHNDEWIVFKNETNKPVFEVHRSAVASIRSVD